MVNQQLIDYIKNLLRLGKNKEEIRNILLANGWQINDIDESFRLILSNEFHTQSSLSSSVSLNLPGSVFLLKNALSIYRKHFFTFLGILLIPLLTGLFFIFIPIIIGIISFTTFFLKLSAFGIGLSIFSLILILFILFVIQIWSQSSLLYAIKDNKENIGVIESYRRGRRKIFSLGWIFLLTSFIILGGYLFFIVPGIIFTVWFSLSQFILITEDIKGINALFKSKEYVRGKWGSVFWRILFFVFLILIFSLVLASLSYLIHLKGIVNLIISLFLMPLLMVYLFLLYENLKFNKREFIFAPPTRQKAIFILFPILSLLPLLAVIFLLQKQQKANFSKKEVLLRNIQFDQKKQELKNFSINGNLIPSIQPILTQSTKPTISPLVSNNQKITASLEGYVFIDKNKNKIFDSGETSFSDGYVILGERLSSGGGKGTGIKVKPDNNGYYKIDIFEKGTYYADFIFQPGSETTIIPAGSNKGDFLITGKEIIKNYNFVINLE